MLSLIEKVAVITGSNRGLGRAVAIELAKRGAILVLNYRKSKKAADKAFAEIKRHSPKSILIKANVSSEKDVKRMFSYVFKRFHRVDILINNVGNFLFKKISQHSHSEFRGVIESNLYGTFLCSKSVLEKMRARKYGKIINIGCAGCDRITIREHTTPYYIAKTGVYMLTKAMAAEEAKYKININMVSPGILETSIVKQKVPAGRLASHKDIINAILFLLNENSSYINGANIEVAGGWVPGHSS
ncbi:TPA: SDR family oxidoreductase [archaeon]|uniref:SDR family oxidoreductase n=1 Tax=Candidatus Naiadarchaeum limnaeum TaxID=2756139 RepID=A0A832XJS5_9ARCH|nr:SDR family oxidoreductase [Candidatus Naiadarchaeum limnaeum]